MRLQDCKRIVVLNLIPNTVGDSLYLISLLRVLRRNAPTAHIALTCAPLTQHLLKYEPSIDELKVFDQLEVIGKKVSVFTKTRRYVHLMNDVYCYLRENRFDACIVGLPLFWPVPLLPFLARIPLRVGHSFKGSILDFLLTIKVRARGAAESGEKSRHFVELYLDLCRAMGLDFDDEDIKIRYEPSDDDKIAATAILAGFKHKRIIGFQPGAKWPEKRWSEESFVELGQRILAADDTAIVLVGSAAEKEMNERIRMALGERCMNVCGIDVGTMAAVLKRCELVVANTSGLLHVASAVGTRTVGLYWIGPASQSKPIGMGLTISVEGSGYCKECESKKMKIFDQGCKHSVSVEHVWQAVKQALISRA